MRAAGLGVRAGRPQGCETTAMPNSLPSASPEIVTAAVLVIGDEILSGRTKDKNIGYIADYLTALGIDLREVRVVPDVEEEMSARSTRCARATHYVFTTGGIGPTHDDITADCVAKAFGVPLHFHPRGGRADEGATGEDGRRAQRGAHAHDAHPGRRRARRSTRFPARPASGSAMSSSWPASPR